MSLPMSRSESPGRQAVAATESAGIPLPRAVAWGGTLAVALLVAGAVYLMLVRGDALMLDLQALSRFAFCY